MFPLLLPQNILFWITYYILLRSYSSLLLIVILWWSLLSDVFMISLVLYSTLIFLLVSQSDSSSSNTYCICPHIFSYFLLLQTTNSSLLSTLLFSISFYNATRLSPLSIPHSLVYTLFLISTLSFLSLAICLLSISWLLLFSSLLLL